jgi:hypothetical protein
MDVYIYGLAPEENLIVKISEAVLQKGVIAVRPL